MDEYDPDQVKFITGDIQSVAKLSSNGQIMKGVEDAAMILAKVEMDIACSTEKLCNLNVLMMNVMTRESDLEASVLVKEEIPDENVLEFNILCGILDLEVHELESFLDSLHDEIIGFREIVSSPSSVCIEKTSIFFEEKLRDCEEQLEDLKVQSADLQKSSFFMNSSLTQETHFSRSSLHIEDDVHVPMQTEEQQRHVLSLLEKSLARELDLDAKLNEARQNEEELKWRLILSNQEASYMEILMQDLKAEVSNAKCYADGALAKCLALSESNVQLNDEVSFLRSRLEKLEVSIHETDEIKSDIDMRAKVITNLVMQLAMERDRLHEQLYSLAKQNKSLVARLETADDDQYASEIEAARGINTRMQVINHLFVALAVVVISLVLMHFKT